MTFTHLEGFQIKSTKILPSPESYLTKILLGSQYQSPDTLIARGFNEVKLSENLGDKKRYVFRYSPFGVIGELETAKIFAFIITYDLLQNESIESLNKIIQRDFGLEYVFKFEQGSFFPETNKRPIIFIGKRDYQGQVQVINIKTKILGESISALDAICKWLHSSLDKPKGAQKLTFEQSIIENQSLLIFFYPFQYLVFWKQMCQKSTHLARLGTIQHGRSVGNYGLSEREWKITRTTEHFTELSHRENPEQTIKFPLGEIYWSMDSYKNLAKYPAIIPPKRWVGLLDKIDVCTA